MAKYVCPICRKEVSTEDERCPYCGVEFESVLSTTPSEKPKEETLIVKDEPAEPEQFLKKEEKIHKNKEEKKIETHETLTNIPVENVSTETKVAKKSKITVEEILEQIKLGINTQKKLVEKFGISSPSMNQKLRRLISKGVLERVKQDKVFIYKVKEN